MNEYKPLTDSDRNNLLSMCSGRSGGHEAETVLSRQNGSDHWLLISGNGGHVASILKRDPSAVMAWRVWSVGEQFTVWLKLDARKVRAPSLWLKSPGNTGRNFAGGEE